MVKFETDAWPMIPSKWFTRVDPAAPRRRVRLIVIHTAEYPERRDAARGIARYLADPRDAKGDPVKASAHICVDSLEIVQCVKDNDVAYAAPGANSDGIQIELTGYAGQGAVGWADEYSRAVLNHAAQAAAQYCLKYDIPVRKLTDAELRAGARGIIGHDQATRVYKGPGRTHTDPGPHFPWDCLLKAAALYVEARRLRAAPIAPVTRAGGTSCSG